MKLISEGVYLFENDDEGHFKWISENPNGYVLNTYNKPTPNYLKTHKATCPTISILQSRYSSFTTEYRKYCFLDVEKLKFWAKSECNASYSFV